MVSSMPQETATSRLTLEPLVVDHAFEMAAVLADPTLYTFTGGEPPSSAELRRRYEAQVAGSGHDGELWLNWIARLRSTGEAIGFVQATVEAGSTDLAWTIGTRWQGRGYASESVRGVAQWLRAADASPLGAWIHPDHRASQGVARAVGLLMTAQFDDDGEQRWIDGSASP